MSSFQGRLLHWRALASANPWPFVACFAVGAVLAFVYSYVPLHTVNTRKIDRLEAAVLAKEDRVDVLVRELAELREGAEEAPDASQLDALTTERDEAVRARKLAEKEVASSKRRVKKLEGERAQWKRKIAALEADVARATAVAAEPVRAPEPSAPSGSDGSLSHGIAAPADALDGADAEAGTPPRAMAGGAPPEGVITPASPAP